MTVTFTLPSLTDAARAVSLPHQFTAALNRLLDDADARARLQQQRQDVLARYTRFDGHAAERIAGLIAGPPAESSASAGVRPLSPAQPSTGTLGARR